MQTQFNHTNNSSCAHCVLSSIDIATLTKSKPEIDYQSNVNFIRCTPNIKEKPIFVDFRSVDQPKKRNSIDYTDGLTIYTKNIAKKLNFSPNCNNSNNTTKSIENTPSKKKCDDIVQEKCLSKRFLIECFKEDSLYRLCKDDELIAMDKKFQKIYEKCWQQTSADRPSSKKLVSLLSNFLKCL